MINNKKIELVQSIQALSLEIANNSDIDIFYDFSSHVKVFIIKVILNGWNNGEYETDLYKTVYLDWNCEKELYEILEFLKTIKEEL